ncbi:hypothetical protein [Mucilaginibacter pedocola]|nr:hypothetical protein [Mucilaginibacter pedocola]
MKLLQTILCLLGAHDWRLLKGQNKRQCIQCNLRHRRTFYDCTKWEKY